MTPLRQRMIDDMKLRGLSANTREAYLGAVRQLAAHYHRSPEYISEQELRAYFLHLITVRKLARQTITIAVCAVKFLYEKTLDRKWPVFDVVRPPRRKKLPVILSAEEVRKILSQVRIPVYRVCLTTIYSCGLRVTEGAELEIRDVDSARMVLQVRGKGGNRSRCRPGCWRSCESTGNRIDLLAGCFLHRGDRSRLGPTTIDP